MVFETGALLSFLDVGANIGLGLKLRHVPAAERERRVEEEALDLRLGAVVLRRRPGQLSRGERGRADLGRALIRRPSAWLLDEPLAHLDPPERFALRHRLVREAKQQEIPTIYVTHDPVEALAAGDRVGPPGRAGDPDRQARRPLRQARDPVRRGAPHPGSAGRPASAGRAARWTRGFP